ncbi:MAG: pyridoxal phosphate-dependent aminotransferase [Lachnospiraceae bacterium]
MYQFDKEFDRHGTEVIKWDRMKQDFGKKDLIPLGIADMDFETLPEIVSALKERAEHPTYGYTYASEDYYNNFIAWNKKRNGFEVKKEEMISVPGIVCANAFIVAALTEPGDKILMCTPVYDPFFKVVEQQKRTLVKSSLIRKNDRYEMDYEDLDRKMADGVKLFVLCNPHNPIGRVWEKEELEKLNELCKKHNVLVFSDDIHSDIIFEGHTFVPYITISEDAAKRSVCVEAPSKTFNVAGIKTSVIFSKNPQLLTKVNEIITAFHVGVNLFGFKALEVAYKYGEAYVDELCAYLKANAEYVTKYIEENIPKAHTYVPDGTYLLWIDCTESGFSQKELMQRLVDAGVAPNDGSHYGEEGEGFVRINIGTQRRRLEEAMECMKRALC